MRLKETRGLIWPALIALVARVVNGAVFVAKTYPGWHERQAAQLQYDQGERELYSVRQQLRTLQVLGGDALVARDDLGALLAGRLLHTSELPQVLAHVRASAGESGVRVESIDYAAEPVAELEAIRLQISVRGAGSYTAARSWMSRLREGPGLMFVDRAEIGGSGGSVLSIEVTAVALLRAGEVLLP